MQSFWNYLLSFGSTDSEKNVKRSKSGNQKKRKREDLKAKHVETLGTIEELRSDLEHCQDLLQFHINENSEFRDQKRRITQLCHIINKENEYDSSIIPCRTFGMLGQNVMETLRDEQLIELGEKYISNPKVHIFKTKIDKNGKAKTVVDHDNEYLLEIETNFGKSVKSDVIRVLCELERWNPSGRLAVSVPWNAEKGKELTLSEIFSILYMNLKEAKGM